MVNKLNKIHSRFGQAAQLKKLREECMEFVYAFDNNTNIKEEAADVFNVAAGLIMNDDDILLVAMHKQERTIKRIKEGYYD